MNGLHWGTFGGNKHEFLSDPPADLLVSIMASRRTLKAVLIDLSGTLHVEDTAVPGAQEALNRWESFRFLLTIVTSATSLQLNSPSCDSRLRQASVAVKFVTNTTKECKRALVERLRRLDFNVQVDPQPSSSARPRGRSLRRPSLMFAMASQEREIFTSLSAARSLLEQERHRPLLLLEESALEDFTGGFQEGYLPLAGEVRFCREVAALQCRFYHLFCVKVSTHRSRTLWWSGSLRTTSTTRSSTRPSGASLAHLDRSEVFLVGGFFSLVNQSVVANCSL